MTSLADPSMLADPTDLAMLDLPGVTPARQKRSQDMMRALLEAGERILRSGRVEDLSIEGLCAEIGASVGAFYSRFDSKEAYFNALQRIAFANATRLTARALGRCEDLRDLRAICRVLVESDIAWMRMHEGIVRASLQRGPSGENRWAPFKTQGQEAVAFWTPLLLAALGRDDDAARRTIAIMFQVLFGLLVNAVLNDPGPLRLADPSLADDVTTIALRCLGQQ